MRYTLKDYQTDAVSNVLTNLRKARRYYKDDGDRSQFSLSATTGAGKTVMAAAVIEALFFGSDEFDFEPDPGAVVVWFSDDPSLNEQSRARLRAASDKLDRMIPVKTTFNHLKFNPQTVYFLNTQKFSKHSLLVRGAMMETDNSQEMLVASRPDEQQNSIWDTITNTIEDESFTLYFILDEAHRGMGIRNSERPTIVKRLINGHGTVPPLPIVWGISATVERFEKAMSGTVGRTALPSVDVDSARVQASGLLKDDIILGFPKESGRFDTVLLKRAVRKVVESTNAWAEYTRDQRDTETVVPLLVVQVPDKASDQMLADAVATIQSEWPSNCLSLEFDAFANVFGEHKNIVVGQTSIPYIEPERVQDARHIRVLFAKNAISTGWDCPRAEVMMSFRPAKDTTHITQLLGRMVRTPLARRIPGNEILNSVYCLLPFFDNATATAVANRLMKGSTDRDDEENATGTGGGEGRRILFEPIEMTPNPAVTESVWERYLALPSETIPKKNAKPIKRLTALAQALSTDNLVDHAGDKAHNHLHRVLDGLAVRYRSEVESAVKDVQKVEGKNLRVNMVDRGISDDEFTEIADNRAIEDAYRAARRAFSDDVARTYVECLAGHGGEDELREAHVKVAALALIPEIVTEIESEADRLATRWFTQTRVERTRLSDRKQAEYDDIQAMSSKPQRVSLGRPNVRQEDTRKIDDQGNEMPLPTRTKHLLADTTGAFPIRLNEWETTVLDTEMARPGFCAWYRNPSRVCKESLAVSYEYGPDDYHPFCPDFIFFVQMDDGSIVADIVDPHGFYLADALPKLRGLARFAETYGADFHRIEAVAKVGEKLKVLDLTKPTVINAVKECTNLEDLYVSELAQDYC